MFGLLTLLTISKLLFKYLRFYKARRSVALGRSPRLIVGYMAELTESQGTGQHIPPPALIVQGEETGKIEKGPRGYSFEGTPEPDQGDGTSRECSQLVTLDRVWGLDDDKLPSSKPKDLCFSFALFKLLRCRFAKYTVLEAGFMKASRFFQAILLEGNDYERVFRVVADELSFIHDYYYSTPPSNIILSLFSIGCCSYMAVFIWRAFRYLGGYEQIYCLVWCPDKHSRRKSGDRSLFRIGHGNNKIGTYLDFGNTYYDVVPVCLVILVLVFSEIRDIVSRIGSKWSKVALVCKYAKNASDPERSTTCLQKRIAFVFRFCRFRLVKSWEGKMNQCSILVLCPCKISLLARRLLRLPNQRKTKVPRQLQEAIFQALKREDLTSEQAGGLKLIRPPLSPFLDSTTGLRLNAFSVISGKGAADTILGWHIATSIYEVRHPQPSDAKVAATHLSRYCAYLVIYLPGLLPDDDEWCESLHQAVKKDADRALAGRAGSAVLTPEAKYQQLVDLLSADSNHEVLKNGAWLGKQLVNLQTGWGALARFWSEMILYVAPSENLDGHAEAIACGGELITLLWALLAHAGIASRETRSPPAADQI
ncbi:hypothetical protein BAE44_0002614 [Dichanthelium oligosanthes]|uniref:DUF4220 domain-containing protein n=1 Tax=Dichanthelium oligosanthes TaxID=888268 RepID=A0A1E5WG49_9POAL|nr:hypothetical protein BAE44_0002614 [Dichanthelium oligosanthes]